MSSTWKRTSRAAGVVVAVGALLLLGAPGQARAEPAAAPAESPSSETSPAASDLAAITSKYSEGEPKKMLKRPRHREAGAPPPKLMRASCFSDPEKCKCTAQEQAKLDICQPVIGYFCPESTLNLMASMCVSLFGGVTACRCATQGELQSHVNAEAKKSGKKKKNKKKSSKSSKSSKKK